MDGLNSFRVPLHEVSRYRSSGSGRPNMCPTPQISVVIVLLLVNGSRNAQGTAVT